MATAENDYAKGDWIVHSYYGVGKVKKIEKKKINGERKKFYRVESDASIYWIPVEGASESHIRAIANRATLRQAMNLLKEKPKEMASNFKARQIRIKEVLAKGNLRPMIRLVRDLWGRSQVSNLSMTELNALRQAMENLVVESAVAEGTSNEAATSKLIELLNEHDLEPTEGSSKGMIRKFLNWTS